jgi:hypothetical protein
MSSRKLEMMNLIITDNNLIGKPLMEMGDLGSLKFITISNNQKILRRNHSQTKLEHEVLGKFFVDTFNGAGELERAQAPSFRRNYFSLSKIQ